MQTDQQSASNQTAVESAVRNSLDQSVISQPIALQQALNKRRIAAITSPKRKPLKLWSAVVCSLFVVWVTTPWLAQDAPSTNTNVVALTSEVEVISMSQDVPQIELEALEHTDFLLWMAESTSD